MIQAHLHAKATQQISELLDDPKLTRNQRLRALEIAAKLVAWRDNSVPMLEGDEAAELLRSLGLGQE